MSIITLEEKKMKLIKLATLMELCVKCLRCHGDDFSLCIRFKKKNTAMFLLFFSSVFVSTIQIDFLSLYIRPPQVSLLFFVVIQSRIIIAALFSAIFIYKTSDMYLLVQLLCGTSVWKQNIQCWFYRQNFHHRLTHLIIIILLSTSAHTGRMHPTAFYALYVIAGAIIFILRPSCGRVS